MAPVDSDFWNKLLLGTTNPGLERIKRLLRSATGHSERLSRHHARNHRLRAMHMRLLSAFDEIGAT
jgi:hypothetical protein